MSPDNKSENKTNNQKTAAIIAVAILVLVSLAAIFFKYYSGNANFWAAANNTDDSPAEPISPEQLASQYQADMSATLENYLSVAETAGAPEVAAGDKTGDNQVWLSADFRALTARARTEILAFKVPVDLRDYHLSAVLLFDDIDKNIGLADIVAVGKNLADLRAKAVEFRMGQ